MSQATETFAVGAEQVTVAVEIDLNSVWLISGNFSGTIPSGEIGFINGDVNLTGDLIVEGLLTGIDTFTLTGNGFQILVQNGGQINLQGVEKSAWVHWGDIPIGWQTGDAILSTPTAAGVFVPNGLQVAWNGTWPARLTNAPDVTLPGGSIVKPEVINRTRSIVLQNLSRIHFHDDPGVQTLRHLAVINSGITGVLARYPIHFHLCGESVRGSLLEGVLVNAGKNHAFVVHGSHGVTLRDCVAYNTIDDAFWWDPPPMGGGTSLNDSDDVKYEHCIAYYVIPKPGDQGYRLTAFNIGMGDGNSVTGSAACCVQGQPKDSSGFQWPESGSGTWEFHHNVSHNNRSDGIFTWQNGGPIHEIEDFVAYHNGLSGIDHGAYTNTYRYRRCVIKGGSEAAFRLHALGSIVLQGIVSDGKLRIEKHSVASPTTFVVVRDCIFSLVDYRESGGTIGSNIRYENLGLIPANYSMVGAVNSSVAEIYEGGVLTHRWTQGAWT